MWNFITDDFSEIKENYYDEIKEADYKDTNFMTIVFLSPIILIIIGLIINWVTNTFK